MFFATRAKPLNFPQKARELHDSIWEEAEVLLFGVSVARGTALDELTERVEGLRQRRRLGRRVKLLYDS